MKQTLNCPYNNTPFKEVSVQLCACQFRPLTFQPRENISSKAFPFSSNMRSPINRYRCWLTLEEAGWVKKYWWNKRRYICLNLFERYNNVVLINWSSLEMIFCLQAFICLLMNSCKQPDSSSSSAIRPFVSSWANVHFTTTNTFPCPCTDEQNSRTTHHTRVDYLREIFSSVLPVFHWGVYVPLIVERGVLCFFQYFKF